MISLHYTSHTEAYNTIYTACNIVEAIYSFTVYPGTLGFLPIETYLSHWWQQKGCLTKISSVFQKKIHPTDSHASALKYSNYKLDWSFNESSPSHNLHRELTTVRFIQVHEEILYAITITTSYVFPNRTKYCCYIWNLRTPRLLGHQWHEIPLFPFSSLFTVSGTWNYGSWVVMLQGLAIKYNVVCC